MGDNPHIPGRIGWVNNIPIILLAAGQSSRMGGEDKLMREIDGCPLLRRSAQIAMTAGPVIVALPPEPHPRHAALRGLPARAVSVPDAHEGMNASLRRALAALPSGAPAAMVLLADLPDLTRKNLEQVMRAVDDYPGNLIWRGATQTGEPGHPVIFHRSLWPELSSLTGDDGASPVVRRHSDRVHLVPLPGIRARFDLDTPGDWSDWMAKNTGTKK